MRRWMKLFLAVLTLAFAAVAVAENDNGGFSSFIFFACLIIGIAVVVVLFYSLVKFRQSRQANFHKHLGVEVVWTAIPLLILALVLILIFWLTPAYNMLSDLISPPTVFATKATAAKLDVDNSRKVGVTINTFIEGSDHLKFIPLVHHMTVHPGQVIPAYLFAKNKDDHPLSIRVNPRVEPERGTRYLKVVDCFCQQPVTLKAGQRMDLPVNFYVDPSLPSNYKDISLSFTAVEPKGQKSHH